MLKGKNSKGILFLLMLFLVVMTACSGNNQSSGDNEGDTGSDSKDSGSSEEKIELEFWNTWTDPTPQNEANIRAIERFMEENPNIVIKQQQIPHDQYKVKLKTQAAGKQLPDLMQVWPGAELKPLVDGGLVTPIDDIVSHWDGLIESSQLSDYNIDGSQYAIPGNVTPTGLVYYDKDMIAEVGYDKFPTTYEDFKALIQKLKDNGTIPIALGNKGQWVLQSAYISTIADRFTGSDFLSAVLDDGSKTFNDEKFIQGVNVIKELAEMEAFNEDFNSIDNNQHRDLFILGDAAIMIDGAWSLGPVVEGIPEDKNVGIAPFPSVTGGDGNQEAVSAVTGTGIAINSELSEKEIEAAKLFLKSFYSEEYYKELNKASILVPANIETPEGVDPLLTEVANIMSNGVSPVYDAVLPTELTDIINTGLQEVTLGTLTPEELADKLQKALEK